MEHYSRPSVEMKILTFDSLPSTNQYCELLDLNQYEEFTVINAIEQTAGIGQRGNHWEAAPGKNLTFSIILKPTFVPIADQFQLTKTISLGITDWLKTVVPKEHVVKIKWPNDIYVDQKKICGTLTSAKINGTQIASAISGIGININQTQFSSWIPNPISLVQLLKEETTPEDALQGVLEAIRKRYNQLKGNLEAPDNEYLENLLHIQEKRQYIYHGRVIEAAIKGVNRFGHLELLCATGETLCCQMKEIQWVWQN